MTAADDWRHQAACWGSDPELWFPTQNPSPDCRAMRVCHRCPVESECLTWAQRQRPWGIWGGVYFPIKRLRADTTPYIEDLLVQHGTSAGIRLHDRRNEPICDACSAYRREVRELNELRKQEMAG